jgi:superfamily II DNA helicase RecQ
MSEDLQRARSELARYFGYPVFGGRQPEAVQAVLDGRDVLVLMPTGSEWSRSISAQ